MDPPLSRPRLLFLCQTLPYPPDTGVAVRSFNILRQLCREYDVTALCFYRRKAVEGGLDPSERVARMEVADGSAAFRIPQEYSRGRLALDHLRSVLTARPYTEYVYRSAEFNRGLGEALRRPYDIYHVDSLDLSACLPLLPPDSPTVLVHHNVESALLRRRAGVQGSRAMAAYMSHQASLYQRWEARWCPRADLNVVVSANDGADLRRIAGGGRFQVVPNGVDTGYFHASDEAALDGRVVFLGGTEWFPNRDALDFFCADILPRIRKRAAPEVFWVGRSTAAEQEEFASTHDVRLTGYVPDIRVPVEPATCCVVPLRIGGGTRLKITTAWSMGKAVVSTSMGCEGLEAVDGENILIRDDPADFADAVLEVLGDPDLARSLGRNARRTAEEIYDWNAIGRDMLDSYQGLHNRGAMRA